MEVIFVLFVGLLGDDKQQQQQQQQQQKKVNFKSRKNLMQKVVAL